MLHTWRRLNGLDLFSGIGGNTLGLGEWVKTIAYCEQDKHAQSVLLSRMAGKSIESAPIWDDVTTLKGDMFDIPIDIIIAGFPCQDISVAGKGAGLAGERSGLFFQIMRLAQEIRPTFLFLENVPAIRTRGLDTVIQELTKAGYDCRWTMLSAADVGAKHKRERWFLLAYSKSCGSSRELRFLSEKNGFIYEPKKQEDLRNKFDNAGQYTNSMANTMRDGLITSKIRNCVEPSNDKPSSREKWSAIFERRPQTSGSEFSDNSKRNDKGTSKSDLGGMADGLSADVVQGGPKYLDSNYWEEEPEGVPRVTQEKDQRVERIKRLGNGVVPLQAKTAFNLLLNGV